MKIQRRKRRQNESPAAPVQAQFQSRPFQDANFAPPERESQPEASGFDFASIPLFSNGNSTPTQQGGASNNHAVRADSISNVQKSPINIIQREIIDATVKSAIIGGRTLYTKEGEEIGSIKPGSKIIVDWIEDDENLKVKRSLAKDKFLCKLIEFNEEDVKFKKPITNYNNIYINSHAVDSSIISFDQEDDKSKYSQLKSIGLKLLEYKAIHENYKKYQDFLGSKLWNLISYVWNKINDLLSYIKYIDPSGITSAIVEVSSQVKSIVDKMAEAYLLATDPNLVGELKPLLPKTNFLSLLTDAGKFLAEKVFDEVIEIDGKQLTVNRPWDGQTNTYDLYNNEEEQFIEI
ncbi:MAG: hypothetical protein ACP5D7_03780 [Limnospira sp.]